MPSRGADLVTEISLPEATESFELFVRDFGITVDAGSLHPARAIREADTFYQQWMGFDLTAGTRIPVHVAALPPRSPTSPWLNALVAAFGTAALLIWVGRPATARSARSATTAEDSADREPEKAALIAALEDLEHDYETGKLSAPDREQLREELRREALHALAQRRATSGATEPERICACGNRPGSADRFCSDCGARL